MDQKEEFFDKTPFYMTYPIQNLYLAEMEYEKDMERMKELYPKEVREILKLIEARCDELETEGSRLYDENPDRLMMEEEACRLYQQFLQNHPQEEGPPPRPMPAPMPAPTPMPAPMPIPNRRFPLELPEELKAMMGEDYPDDNGLAMQERHGHGHHSWLRSLFQVLFDDELYRRRCKYRRCKRWW